MATMYTVDSDGWVQMCTGGPRWRTTSDQMIEIEGRGIVYASSTDRHGDALYLDHVLDTLGDKIKAYSDAVNLDPDWTAAIIVIESRGKNTPANSAEAGGVMALLKSTMASILHRPADLNNIDDSIEAGTKYLAQKSQIYHGQLAAVAPSYNAGSAICSPTTKCKATIDGKWQFDGTTAPNSMFFVEDCTAGKSSEYAIRAIALNNTLKQRGWSKDRGSQPPSGSTDAGMGVVATVATLAASAMVVGAVYFGYRAYQEARA